LIEGERGLSSEKEWEKIKVLGLILVNLMQFAKGKKYQEIR